MVQLIPRLIKWIFTFTYFPVVFFNPVFVLHFINTYASYANPPPQMLSSSCHPILEHFGPLPGSSPYLDMHDDSLCWRYTAFMFVLQYMAFEQVYENRERAREEKLRRKKFLKERSGKPGSSEEAANRSLEVKLRGGLEHMIYVSRLAIGRWFFWMIKHE